MPLLEIKELTAGYGDVDVLHGVSLMVEEGEIVSLVGANGAGKTTLLRAIWALFARMGTLVFVVQPLVGCRRTTSYREASPMCRKAVSSFPI